ncbi:hypothetical protein C8A05DRAFT_18478 [Staphylotrichum tortipilum]|uniref:Uncharacterized protein n=1 Tax=Staphylotrichum tortipilum TaxID=2831512 RepID=A0AAN6MF20_9PEZI|nr:hypothetical protein C8A05DRAFT_18478 [Staphylotrichum longicolle]
MSPSSSWKTRTGEPGTLLGPMTTAWSPPAGCGVHLVTCPTCVDGYQAQQCIGDAPQDNSRCWPPVASQVGPPKYPYFGWGYYSPGLACPTGYTAACTAKYGVRPEWLIQFDMVPGETAIGCCPEGFHCANNDGNTCYAIVSATATVAPTGMCSKGSIVGIVQATLPAAMTITATTTVDGSAGVATRTETPDFTLWAPMLQINHRPSDLESVSTASSSTSSPTSSSGSQSTPTNPTSAGSASTSGVSSPPSTGGQSNGLSTGAVAGIGVGAAFGVLFLAAIAGCLLWTRHRRRREAAAGEDWDPPPPPPVTNSPVPANDPQYYYGSSSEMPTKEALTYMRPELDEVPSAVEMPAGDHPPWRGTPQAGQGW